MTIKLKKMTIIIEGDDGTEVIEVEGVRFADISYSKSSSKSIAELNVNVDFHLRDNQPAYITKRLDKDGNEIGS